MAHEPYVYEYFGEQGVLIPPSTSFLVPFIDQIENWRTLYCVAALAIEHHAPDLNERISVTEYSNLNGYPDMQTLELGTNGNTFIESGTEYNYKFAIGLKDEVKYQDVADYPINFMGITNPYIGGSVSQLYYFNDETVNLNLLSDSMTGIALGFEYKFIDRYENILFNNLNNKFLNFGDPNKMVNQLDEHLLFLGMKFQIINPNSSTQAVQISIQELTGQTSTNKSNFRSFIDNFSPDFTTQSLDYTNFSLHPISIPKNFYIKWPFTRSRLRLHAFYINATENII